MLPEPDELSSQLQQCPLGTDVPVDKCHLAGIAVSKEMGMDNIKWDGYSVGQWSGFPCGCFINIISKNIHYKGNKGWASKCGHKSGSRLICQVGED